MCSATLVLFVGVAGPASSYIVRKPGEQGICGSCRDTRARVSLQHERQPRVDLLAECEGHAAQSLELTGRGAVETRSNWYGLNAGRREVAITAAMVRVREIAVSDTGGKHACAS